MKQCTLFLLGGKSENVLFMECMYNVYNVCLCVQTVYHFDIQKNYFYSALDRFAQFFIEPLMKKGSVDRELEAIDSGNWRGFCFIPYLICGVDACVNQTLGT